MVLGRVSHTRTYLDTRYLCVEVALAKALEC